jgi:predicted dienelactone hydrolase
VLSHGNGGSGIIHRTTGADLARAGYVVALLEHPGNNRNDNALARTIANLERRPRHVSLVIDWAFAASPFAASLVPGTVAVIGHSLGAYTALAVAGGIPTSSERDSPDGRRQRIEVTPDERVKALVLLAPATPWFMAPDALRAVHIPILVLSGEKDDVTPDWHAQIVVRGVADANRVEHRTIANAGHFSFQSPFPDVMKRPGLAPAHDPDGFDRARYNAEMNADIIEFLKRVL